MKQIEIEFGGVPLIAEYRWLTSDVEDIDIIAIKPRTGADMFEALAAAAVYGAKNAGHAYGADSALFDRLCELIADAAEKELMSELDAAEVI